jgi:predicted aminopeptidase
MSDEQTREQLQAEFDRLKEAFTLVAGSVYRGLEELTIAPVNVEEAIEKLEYGQWVADMHKAGESFDLGGIPPRDVPFKGLGAE